MKRTLPVLLAMLIALSFAACAAPAGKHSYKKVKCPACGYQFEAPAKN